MPREEIINRIEKLVDPYRITKGSGFRLEDIDPGDTRHLKSDQKDDAKEMLAAGVEWLAEEQSKLFAQDRWAVLLVFQAMDAAGKDGTIKHVMSGVNPQGCQMYSFKAPSSEELDHDFLLFEGWRPPPAISIGEIVRILQHRLHEAVRCAGIVASRR